MPLKAARQRGERRKIPFDLHPDAGALYLHRHLAAIGQPRPMHLRQRRCGEWFPVKFDVQRAERRTELTSTIATASAAGKGPTWVCRPRNASAYSSGT